VNNNRIRVIFSVGSSLFIDMIRACGVAMFF